MLAPKAIQVVMDRPHYIAKVNAARYWLFDLYDVRLSFFHTNAFYFRCLYTFGILKIKIQRWSIFVLKLWVDYSFYNLSIGFIGTYILMFIPIFHCIIWIHAKVNGQAQSYFLNFLLASIIYLWQMALVFCILNRVYLISSIQKLQIGYFAWLFMFSNILLGMHSLCWCQLLRKSMGLDIGIECMWSSISF